MHTAVIKAPGEKLLRVSIDMADGLVQGVRLTGDFFVHPEEAVLRIEEALRGVRPELNTVRDRLREAVDSGGIQLIGLSIESIARGTVEAASGCDAEKQP
ncbi:MAG TPA: lipoate protein ligase C-terminal domain-containing protein [Spirochaetota bacterium]|nr:lipoate protein ligase C-terminal domain-containing protein [Spirochaetota bacterium]